MTMKYNPTPIEMSASCMLVIVYILVNVRQRYGCMQGQNFESRNALGRYA